MTDDTGLFELPDQPPLKLAASLRQQAADAKPTLTRLHRRDRVPCEECLTLLYEAGGVGPYARGARWRLRLTRASSVSLLLCHEHADAWRATCLG